MKKSELFLIKNTPKRRTIDEGTIMFTESLLYTYGTIVKLETELELLEKLDPDNKNINKIKIKLDQI